MEEEIRIRLSEYGFNFIYSILRGGQVIDSAVVCPIGPPQIESAVPEPEPPALMEIEPEYYGGSQAMD